MLILPDILPCIKSPILLKNFPACALTVLTECPKVADLVYINRRKKYITKQFILFSNCCGCKEHVQSAFVVSHNACLGLQLKWNFDFPILNFLNFLTFELNKLFKAESNSLTTNSTTTGLLDTTFFAKLDCSKSGFCCHCSFQQVNVVTQVQWPVAQQMIERLFDTE